MKSFPVKLTARSIDTLQVNVGKLCNQRCHHCHVDAGPHRTEIMTRETMQLCLEAVDAGEIETVDLTGGAPEMNPHFRWLVDEISRRGRKTIVRCNLTILVAGKNYQDLPEFFARHRVHVISSLPCYGKENTDKQRGDGVFNRSIEALRCLNRVGYGKNLPLDLVYNPVGAFLPPDQAMLERDYKRELKQRFGIEFNRLFAITNMPIARFRDSLVESGELESYMEKLTRAYNPAAAENVMCRSLLSVGWDGKLYDCDFNQMLELGIGHIREFSKALNHREIITGRHCYGCTAGAGSSCGGTTT